MPYLTNTNSEASAGEYDEATAAVLLGQSTGWQVGEPPPAAAPQAAADRPATVHLVNDQSPESEGDYDAATAAVLLTHGTGWREPEPARARARAGALQQQGPGTNSTVEKES